MKVTFLFEFSDESGGQLQCLLVGYENHHQVWFGTDIVRPSPAPGSEIASDRLPSGGEGICVIGVGAQDKEAMRRALLSMSLGAALMTKSMNERFYKGKCC